MKLFSSAVIVLLLASVASAQPRPGAFTTLQTTNTGVKSVCVGTSSLSGSSSCTGSLQAGAITLATFVPAVTTDKLYSNAGTLFWNGAPVAVGGAVGPGTAGTIPLFSGVNSIGNSLLSQTGTVLTAAATLTSSLFGANTFSAGGVGFESIAATNTLAGVGNGATVSANSDTVLGQLTSFSSTFTTAFSAMQAGTRLLGSGAGGLNLDATNPAGALRFYTVGALRAQYGATGDYSLGSANLTDNVGVPTLTSGFGAGGTIVGRDYAFVIIAGTGAATTGTVTFGHPFTGATSVNCVANGSTPAGLPILVSTFTTTTTTVLTYTSTAGAIFNVLCRGT